MKPVLGQLSLVLCVWAWTSGARAEPLLEPRYAIKLAAEPLVSLSALSDTRSPEYLALHRDLRRARAMLMFGSGLLAAAAVHMALLGRPTICSGYEEPRTRLRTPPIAASLAAAIGIGLLVGGGIKLNHVPAEFRQVRPASAGRVTALVFGAIATAGLASGLLFGIAAPEVIRCD